jgi:hypothetical protein
MAFCCAASGRSLTLSLANPLRTVALSLVLPVLGFLPCQP